MAKVIVLTNQKGGVGKTTSCCALIAGLSAKGYKVLGIDLDPQGNLGFSLGLEIEEGHSAYQVLKGEVSVMTAIRRTQICDILTSNILLSGAELEFTGTGRERLLKQAIEPVMDFYDYIVIDTPPALNILTVNAYAAANYLIIPMVPEILSLLGLSQLKETINTVQETINPDLKILGILLTKYNQRTLLAQEVTEMAQNLAAQIDTVVLNTKIRSSISVAEAPAQGETIFKYAPRSKPAADYRKLVDEVIEHMG